MSQYRVTVAIELEADSSHQAAMRAYSLINDLTPTEFTVEGIDGEVEQVKLDDDETEEALKLAFEGKLFPGLPRTGG